MGWRWPSCYVLRGNALLYMRQQHGETRALRAAVHEDEATVRFDGAMHDRKTEPRATGFRREHRVEDALAQLDRNSRPVIGDAERDRTHLERHAGGDLLDVQS